MPRNGSGSYSLPEAAFIPNTAISSAAVNSDFSDIGDALTDSLARDGQGGMTAVLPLANTGFAYLTDPNTGMRRTGADTQAIQCGGVDVVTATPTGASVAGTLAVSGAITSGGAPLIPVGAGMVWFGSTAPPKWIFAIGQTLLRATYPELWAFAAIEIAAGSLLFTNGNGTTTFTVANMKGRVPANRDDTGTILTSATMTPDGNTMGAIGGAQAATITQANLPAATLTTTINDPGHPHNFGQTIRLFGSAQVGGALVVAQFNNGTDGSVTIASNTTGITASTALGGSGTAFNKVQPTIIVNYIIFAGV
jgi:microcystin-dependent protein